MPDTTTAMRGRGAAPLLAALALCALVPVGAVAQDVDPDRPSFTPFTVPPALVNAEEVSAALTREYPARLREAGIGGRVQVYFLIDAEGRVANRLLGLSSGEAELDEAALRVADVFRFTPAMNRATPVAVWVALPVTFEVPSRPTD